jgi:hypothetical protein
MVCKINVDTATELGLQSQKTYEPILDHMLQPTPTQEK